jgi:hypothetical protein
VRGGEKERRRERQGGAAAGAAQGGAGARAARPRLALAPVAPHGALLAAAQHVVDRADSRACSPLFPRRASRCRPACCRPRRLSCVQPPLPTAHFSLPPPSMLSTAPTLVRAAPSPHGALFAAAQHVVDRADSRACRPISARGAVVGSANSTRCITKAAWWNSFKLVRGFRLPMSAPNQKSAFGPLRGDVRALRDGLDTEKTTPGWTRKAPEFCC